MSGFWYSTAIIATASTLFSLSNRLPSTMVVLDALYPVAPSSASELAAPKEASKEASKEISEKSADEQTFARAMELANHAVVAYQSARKEEKSAHLLALTQQERLLWQATIQTLERISPDSDLAAQASEKKAQYQGLLANAERQLTTGTADFFDPILQPTLKRTRLSADQVHVTLCQIDVSTPQSPISKGEDALDLHSCRHHRGDVQLASPASLIKLPIAIALMDKANTEAIDLTTNLYIDPSNFTENAEGASIDVGQRYPLSQVMTRMINQSNNIATNQLIDYVGRDAIAKTLANRGYSDTLVDHKLAGNRILPPNPGTQSNQLTSNDLTAMMVDTYQLKNAGDEALLRALMSQKDQELGHQALSGMDPEVVWLGEKTGQNKRLIGTTLAMEVKGDRYALTVAIDHSANAAAIRAIIEDTAQYLLTQGSLVQTGGR